jgi:hypothetical protein
MKFSNSFPKGFSFLIGLFFCNAVLHAQQWSGATGPTGDIYRSGNVGIGNTTPAYPLDVTGIVNATALQSGIVNSTAELYLQAYGSVIAGMNTNTFSVGPNTLSVSGIGSFASGSGNILTGSSLSSVSGYENTASGVLSFVQGMQNTISGGGLFGLNYALGSENTIAQTGSFFSKGLNFSLGTHNRIESEAETGGNFTLGIDNLIENNSEMGANFALGINNDISYDNTDGSGGNFAIGYANKIGVTAPASPNENAPGINFLTGVANSIEGGSAACFGWGAGLGFNNTFGSFSIGLSSGVAAGTGGSSYLQNDIPKSLMVGFSDDATLFVKDKHVCINTTTDDFAALYVNSNATAYGYSIVSAVNDNYAKAFAVHNKVDSPALENFRIYGNGETSIIVDDDNLHALTVSKRGSLSTEQNFRVNGKGEVFARKIVVTTSGFPDYVFDKEYKLPSIGEVEQYIKENKHLPEVPSAAEAECEGIDVASMNNILLRKIEELTLYTISQQAQMQKQQQQIDLLIAAARK